jgi:acyl-coenzyme A thioesterase PaaI-like protein
MRGDSVRGMDYDALREGLQQAVPFNSHLRLEIREVSPERGVVALPDRDELRNHVGSQHAGALFSAAEAASGAAFVGALHERLGDIRPLAQRAQIEYKKIAQGEILATARLDRSPEELLEELDAEGVVRFPVDVELADREGDIVAEVRVDWNVRAQG